MRKEVIITSY